MSQGPPQRPGEEPEGSDHPTERLEPADADRPTQPFGPEQGEQPTQAFGVPPGGQTPADQSGYGQQPGQAHGRPAEPGQSQYGQPHQHGDAGQQQRRSPVLVVIGVLVALLVVGGLVFAGINFFAGDDDTAADPEQTEPVGDDLAADNEEEAGSQQTEEDAEPDNGTAQDDASEEGAPQDDGTGTDPQETDDPATEPGGELYDTLTGSVSQVEGDMSSWAVDEAGWTVFDGAELADIDQGELLEAYTATFTSAEGESLTMWAAWLEDPQDAAAWAEGLADERGESDHSGPVWPLEEDEVDDDLERGVFHEWVDGDDIDILWWDDMGVVRHVTGPAEVTRDFYSYLPL